jgi:glycine hydroxymethyltransferase
MDAVREIALREKPRLIISGYTAYPRHLDFAAFRAIAKEVGAYHMTDMAHFAGLVAAKIHPDPIPHADVVTTTTHKTLRGPRGAMILSKVDRLPSTRYRPELLGEVSEKRKTLAQKIDSAVFPGIQGGPLDHVIAAKAVAFKEALEPAFLEYQKRVLENARVLAEALQTNGLRLVTGGTDNHLVLLDLSSTGLSGKQAEKLLDSVGIYTNKNMIPYDTRSAFDPSGLRIGTPAVTTRGFGAEEVRLIGGLIAKTLANPTKESVLSGVRAAVKELVAAHPLYPDFCLS